ncbi:MAG: TAT-variant-translocated molybdopterin oxidoreductase [Planctomycetes bacterium]|nr:TAT-variant-translocated molybdopterin oxidoreductase [Planctomycetota bacterium]
MSTTNLESRSEPVYWRSASQLSDTSEFRELVEREFPEGVAEGHHFKDGVSRRNFLTAVAASVAAASFTSCRKPFQKILPFTHRPEFLIPGVPQHYATALTSGGFGVGLLVRSNDGRPTKVEGNPIHPGSLGGTTAWLQGELLNLYDPARSQNPFQPGATHGHDHAEDDGHGHGGGETAAVDHHAEFEAFLSGRRTALAAAKGQGLHVVLPSSSSPTLARMVAALKKAMPSAVVHRYAPISDENAIEGLGQAYGKQVEPIWALDKCSVIASFDHDFLGTDGDVVRNTKLYAKSRKISDPSQSVSRLYVAESSYSVTGGSADHRFRTAPGRTTEALFALAAELGVGGSAMATALAVHKDKKFPYRKKADWVVPLANDLKQNRGKSAVLVGPRQPAAAHAVAQAINHHLGNVGKTLSFAKLPEGVATTNSIKSLADALNAGSVDTVVAIGVNPVHDAPADLGLAEAWHKAEHTVHVGEHVDETAMASEWHANLAHELEAWGDTVSRDGTVSIQQPLIAPLYHGLSTIEIVARLAGSEVKDGYELVRETWQDQARTDDFDAWWNKALHDGLIHGSAPTAESVTLNPGRVGALVQNWVAPGKPTASAIELEIRPDATVFDGRYANNAWLQELPDPVTKLTWDNAVCMNRKTAEDLGLKVHAETGIVSGPNMTAGANVVAITVDGRTVEGPVWIVPGHADHVVTVTLGQGRKIAHGEVCKHAGFDAYPLRSSTTRFSAAGVKVAKTSKSYELVSSQDHGSMEGRPLYREGTLAEFREAPTFAPDMSPLAKAAAVKNAHAEHGDAHDHSHEEGGDHDHAHGEHEKYTERSFLKSLWKERDYSGRDANGQRLHRNQPGHYQWGMVIDLNSCTGCNACVVACTSENNISMVGKAEVGNGREMFWLRMDRYFSSEAAHGNPMQDDDPGMVVQPVPCMQCENASCESVCPVAATMHSPEGLNDMAYNRCIGTRYCANNCPYKVRRFNWFNNHLDTKQTEKMAFNPNVTVRARGVMEKCTYCVQRISAAKITAKLEDRAIRDGEVVPACAQGCPADAITFGNIADQDTVVSKLRASPLNYAMLSEMNLKPRTTYLAKVNNPNPELV